MNKDDYLQRITKLHEEVVFLRRLLIALLVAAVVLFFLGVLTGKTYGSDLQLASKHRKGFPETDWLYLFYITTETYPEEKREELFAVVSFMVASSSRQPIVERCTPIKVGDTLSYIDLRNLKWDQKTWYDFLLAEYPYGYFEIQGKIGEEIFTRRVPLVIRADWLVTVLGDGTESEIHYQLLYGPDNVPKNRDEFLEFWKVDNDPTHRFGMIEGNSGVAVNEVRWIEFRPIAIPDGFAWGTRDAIDITKDTDPIENLLGGHKHDAEEWIVSIPKISIRTRERGHLIAVLLNDDEGSIQQAAPVNIVEDHSDVRGREIINPVSCYVCHVKGINEPNTNELQRLLDLGVEAYTKNKENAEKIELFHLGSLERTIMRNKENYQLAFEMVSGKTSDIVAPAIAEVYELYDAKVTRETAARELGMEPDSIKLAIAYYDEHIGGVSGRLAGLSHGASMNRTRWEEEFETAYKARKLWFDSDEWKNHVNEGEQ